MLLVTLRHLFQPDLDQMNWSFANVLHRIGASFRDKNRFPSLMGHDFFRAISIGEL